jgi:hypothetical protein
LRVLGTGENLHFVFLSDDYYNQQQKEMQVRRSYSRTANQSPVGKWLKYRFREGFLQMKDSFEKVDQEKTNKVRAAFVYPILVRPFFHALFYFN